MLRSLLTALTLSFLFACSSSTDEATVVKGWKAFGAGVSEGPSLQLAELIGDVGQLNGTQVRLQADVLEVCPKKGCWMTFDTGESKLRVTFEDYGFFVPKDIAGRTVRVEGVFEETEVSLEEARHYLEDAGRDEEAATLSGPQKGYSLVATGVLLESPGE